MMVEFPCDLGPLPPPPLPGGFAERPDVEEQLGRLALTDLGGGIFTVRGQGGLGKTVSVAALVRRRALDLRRLYPDGCFWVTLGEELPSPVMLQASLASALDRCDGLDRSAVVLQDEGHGKAHLSAALSRKRALVVLDDCWAEAHAELFVTLPESISGGSTVLITTRKEALLATKGAIEHVLGSLSQVDAAKMLGGVEPTLVPQVTKLCGGLPLAVAMAASTGSPMQEVLKALQASKNKDPVGRIMEFSLAGCSPEDAERYLELSIFPEDAWVTLRVLEVFYGSSNIANVHAFAERMAQRKLLQLQEASVRLHDLQLAYARAVVTQQQQQPLSGGARSSKSRSGDKQKEKQKQKPQQQQNLQLVRLHARLVDSYSELCGGDWHRVPRDDAYFYEWLPYHLAEARGPQGRLEAARLLTGFRWLDSKLSATADVTLLLADFRKAASWRPDVAATEAFRVMKQGAELSSHVLALEPSQLAFQLAGRLPEGDDAAQPLAREVLEAGTIVVSGSNGPPLRVSFLPRPGLMAAAGGGLRQVLAAHSDWVRCVGLSGCGRLLVTGGNDFTVKIWAVEDGSMQKNLLGHSSVVRGVTILNARDLAVSADEEGVVLVWNLSSGSSLHKMSLREEEPEDRDASAMGVVAIGKTEVAVAFGRAIMLVDAASGGRKGPALKGHGDAQVNGLAFGGGRLVSGAQDGSVAVWRSIAGEFQAEFCLLGCPDEVRSVAIDGEGRRVLAACDDAILRMWMLPAIPTAAKAAARANIKKPTSTTPSTRKSSQSQPAKPPQQQPKQQQQQPIEVDPCCEAHGHTDWVHSVALSPSGDLAASGADDDSMRLWRVSVEPPQLKCIARLPTFSGCFGCAVAPGGKEVFSSSLDIRRWGVEEAVAQQKQDLRRHSSPVTDLSLSEDASLCLSVSADQQMLLWDTTAGCRGECVWGGPARRQEVEDEMPKSCCLSRDGGSAAVGTDEGQVLLYQVEGGSDAVQEGGSTWGCELLSTVEVHEGPVRGVKFTSDGRWIVSAGDEDYRVALTCTETGAMVAALKLECGLTCVAVSSTAHGSEGGFVPASKGGIGTALVLVGGWHPNSLFLCRAEGLSGAQPSSASLVLEGRFDCPGMGRASEVSVTSDACRGMAVSTNDPTEPQIWILGLERMEVLQRVGGVSEWVTRGLSCAISDDGLVGISCTWDRKIQVWGAETGRRDSLLQVDCSPTSLAASPGWRPQGGGHGMVAVGDDSGLVHFLRALAASGGIS